MFKNNFSRSQQLFAGNVFLLQNFNASFDQFPDLVLLAPHYLGRTGNPFVFQIREQQVFLALVMLVGIKQAVEQSPELQYGSRGEFCAAILYFIKYGSGCCSGLEQFFIFFFEYIHGMTFGDFL
ncbi:hypothetical protein DSECCO2_350350 [anaerobic digester metagenome]